MTEHMEVLQASVAMLVSAVSSGLYSLGGRRWKSWRRHIASAVFFIGFIAIALLRSEFSWFMFLLYPALVLQYTEGYGDADVTKRVMMRFIISFTSICTGIGLSFILHIPVDKAIMILIIQALIGVSSIIFAVKNPFKPAFEEALVGMITTMPLMGYLFI